MTAPYRTPAEVPKEPKPAIPFRKRYPRFWAATGMAGTFLLGTAGLSAIFGLIWLIGWVGFAVGIFSGTAPYLLAGFLAILMLLVVAAVGFGAWAIGKLIVCKITGEEFPL